MVQKHTITTVLWVAVGLGIGAVATAFYFAPPFFQKIVSDECKKQYSLTSQSLDCATFDDSASRLKAVDKVIDDASALYTKEGKITRMSVWVRDLESRQTASNNENQRYVPASLLKLPLMIAYFKVAEIEPAILDTSLPYSNTNELNDSTQDFPSHTTFLVGNSYTVEQHIENMIINSDNSSAAALLNHLDPSIFNNTLLDLGIKIMGANSDATYDFVTAKSYANIFRTLYNASYLNRADSQKALSILSQVTFKGIAEALPASTTVSHKFGERQVDNADGSVQMRELHDCGIVYKDKSPYSICVMTQGQNFDDMLRVVQDISLLVYQNI